LAVYKAGAVRKVEERSVKDDEWEDGKEEVTLKLQRKQRVNRNT
jgi:hypothetical protein